ncbi:MAG: helix-hairpin-helix domain-containing protein [Bacteroidota bacterium]
MLAQIKHKIRDHFGFSKAETNGVLILLLFIIIFLTLPQMLKWYYRTKYTVNNDQDIALLDSTLALLEKQRITPPPLPNQLDRHSTPISQGNNNKKASHSPKKIQAFDINTADTSQLQQLQGIGTVLSARIIKYRDKLGGFVSKVQYKEVYGLAPLAIEMMTKHTYIVHGYQPRQININTDDFKTLIAHPYLTYEQVQSIMRHRVRHGELSAVKDLLTLGILEEALFERVKPYLTVH